MKRFVPHKPRWPFTLNRESKQARGLIGWWPGAAPGGPTLFDLSGYGKHGTLTNFASPYTATSGWIRGLDGGSALYCDGTDDFVNVGDNFGGMTAMSVALWFQTPSIPGVDVRAVAGKWGNEAAFDSSDAWVLNYGVFQGIRWFLGGPNAGAVSGTMLTNTTYHAVGTYDGAAVKLYVNGVLAASNAASGTINAASGTNCYIGGEVASSGGGKLIGWVDDVKIYNRALSATEVWRQYDPKTRWELRWRKSPTLFSFRQVTAVPPVAKTIVVPIPTVAAITAANR